MGVIYPRSRIFDFRTLVFNTYGREQRGLAQCPNIFDLRDGATELHAMACWLYDQEIIAI